MSTDSRLLKRYRNGQSLRRSFLLVVLFLGLALGVSPSAQASDQTLEGATVRGLVVDDETGKTLPNAHVFIASSTLGTATNEQGRFELGPVQSGSHRLYASMIGFDAAYVDFVARPDSSYWYTVRMKPLVVQLEGVTVEAKRDPRWEKRLRKFERLFIGESENAKQTHIVNPEVLNFEAKWWGKLKAWASEPLVIENHALGYRITYFLKEFTSEGGVIRYDGEPLYEEMIPASDEQRSLWEANRLTAYYGSFRHFLLTLVAGNPQHDGFVTYRRKSLDKMHRNLPFPITADRIMSDGADRDERRIDFNGYIEVVYTGEEEEDSFLRSRGVYARRSPQNQRSWIELTRGPTVLDLNGEVRDPYGLTVYGYFAFERIADDVPKEYRPNR